MDALDAAPWKTGGRGDGGGGAGGRGIRVRLQAEGNLLRRRGEGKFCTEVVGGPWRMVNEYEGESAAAGKQ